MLLMATITLMTTEKQEWEKRVRSRSGRADEARRARLILLLAAGETWASISAMLGCDNRFIGRWKSRFEIERIAGLYGRHRGKIVWIFLYPLLYLASRA